MKAAVFKGTKLPLKVEEYKTPRPIKDQVLIKLRYAALNHRDEFLSMLHFIESRSLKPIMDRTFPLENIGQAFDRMATADQFGKIIVKING